MNETYSVPLTSFQASRQFRSVFGKHFTALFIYIYIYFFFKDFRGGPVVKTLLPMQGAWVRSLVRELRSHSAAYIYVLHSIYLYIHTHSLSLYIYVYIHTQIYIHTHTHTLYIYTYMSPYIYSMCLHIYIHTHTFFTEEHIFSSKN